MILILYIYINMADMRRGGTDHESEAIKLEQENQELERVNRELERVNRELERENRELERENQELTDEYNSERQTWASYVQQCLSHQAADRQVVEDCEDRIRHLEILNTECERDKLRYSEQLKEIDDKRKADLARAAGGAGGPLVRTGGRRGGGHGRIKVGTSRTSRRRRS